MTAWNKGGFETVFTKVKDSSGTHDASGHDFSRAESENRKMGL